MPDALKDGIGDEAPSSWKSDDEELMVILFVFIEGRCWL